MLAAEFGIEEEAGTTEPTLLERIKLTTLRELSPGQDYKDGVMYYTAPGFLETQKNVGTKKEPIYAPHIETHTVCVTSENDYFMYDEKELFDRGFKYPEVFMAPKKDAWGGEVLTTIAEGGYESPDVYELFFRVRKLYEKYMEFADETYFDLMSAWVMGTYMFKVFRSYAYLHFNGTKDSGKSQNLRLLKAIAFNTHWTGDMTAADLYRGIAGNPGVICIDEQESWKGEKAEAVKGILRSGYSTGLKVTRQRQLPSGKYTQDEFDVYSPKALASINLLDETTASRTIVVHMRPALRAIPEFDATRTARWKGLVDDLHAWGLYNAKGIKDAYDGWTAPKTGHRFTKASELTNRAWEISAPIVVVADYIGGEAFSKPLIEWLTEYFKQARKVSDSMDPIRMMALSLPSVLKNVTASEGWWYSTKDILNQYLEVTDEAEDTKLTTRYIPSKLRPLGFTNIRAGGRKRGQEIQLLEEDVRTVFRERRIEPLLTDLPWFEGSDAQTADKAVQHEVQLRATFGEVDNDQ